MTAMKDFIDYWDNWHKQWHSNSLIKSSQNNSILGWPIPQKKPGNNFNLYPIWRYFPEPYWGNPYTKNLVAVFLNLNPGRGDVCQDILHKKTSILYNTYSTAKVYSKTVECLSKNSSYMTTNWFDKKRVNWLNKLVNCPDINPQSKYSADNILCADLIPWHTPTVNKDVEEYITLHAQHIFKHVIDPITTISQSATLKGLVFAKGQVTETILSKNPSVQKLQKYVAGGYYIQLFKYNNATILVFVGGRGMPLPDPCDKKFGNENINNLSICDIVKKFR